MNRQVARRMRANYGIDAPNVVRRFVRLGASGVLLGILLLLLRNNGTINFVTRLAGPSLSIGCTFLAMAGVMIWGSRIGKLRLRDRLMNTVAWRGDERVLDVGCGHGLMLIAAAKRLTTGVAVGVDIWQKEDQAGNSAEATLKNARAEGVAWRVRLVDGDARRLPFDNGAFDVIVSSWALHNIYDRAGRTLALREIVRVLKPGGQLAIVDIRYTGEYAEVLHERGMSSVELDGPNFLFVIPSYRLTALKAVED
jgi:arsenite methyltransferase